MAIEVYPILGDLNLESIIVIVAITALLYFYYRTYKTYFNKFKRIRNWKEELLFYSFNLKYSNFITNIAIPAFLGLFLAILWPANRIAGIDSSLLFLRSVLVQPIFEEMALRGLFLGSFVIVAKYLYKAYPKVVYYLIVFSGLFVQAYLFAIMHYFGSTFGAGLFIPLFLNGLLYGSLYLIFKRNLLPPTIAHMSFNFVIFVLTM